jgi:uncharacterized protein YciI
MFAITLTYTADLAAIDAALPEHRVWLDEAYAAGVFVASGPQQPRTGGFILAIGTSRADLQDRINADPLHQQGLATYAITEVLPSRVAPGFERLQR